MARLATRNAEGVPEDTAQGASLLGLFCCTTTRGRGWTRDSCAPSAGRRLTGTPMRALRAILERRRRSSDKHWS